MILPGTAGPKVKHMDSNVRAPSAQKNTINGQVKKGGDKIIRSCDLKCVKRKRKRVTKEYRHSGCHGSRDCPHLAGASFSKIKPVCYCSSLGKKLVTQKGPLHRRRAGL